MQSTSIGNRNPSKTLQNVAESARDSAEQMASDLSSKASRIASDTAESANEAYSKASEWIQQNYGKTLGMVGFLAAAGVIGYFLGRGNSKSEFQFPSQKM